MNDNFYTSPYQNLCQIVEPAFGNAFSDKIATKDRVEYYCVL